MPAPATVPIHMALAPCHADIAARAYELFCNRRYAHGHDLVDWLQAEYELRQVVSSAARPHRITLADAVQPVRLEFPILSLNPGCGNVAWRLKSDLRCLAHEGPPNHPAAPGRHDLEAV